MAPTPALFTRMSSPPKFAIARRRSPAAASAGSVMSPTTGFDPPVNGGDFFGQLAEPVFAAGDDDQFCAVAGQFQGHRGRCRSRRR